MGNCLPSQGSGMLSADFIGRQESEYIVVTRSDGKIMEYTPPLLVRDLMAAYPQHSLVHSKDTTCLSLSPDKKLVPGQQYRLLLIPNPPSLSKDAVLTAAKSIYNGNLKCRSSSERRVSTVKRVQNDSGITRVKMVISKRELEALLSDRCMKSKSLVLQRQCKAQYVKEDYVTTRRCSNDRWRTSLESIPEVK